MSALIHKGAKHPEVLVVCDAPQRGVYEAGAVMGKTAGGMFREEAEAAGLSFEEMHFIIACPPLADDMFKSEKRAADHIATHHEDFHDIVKGLGDIKLVICLGKYAAQQWSGRPVKITKVRGVIQPGPPALLPMYSPNHVNIRPEVKGDFRSDLRMAGDFRASGWDFSKQQSRLELGEYEWCFDINHLLRKPPELITADTETRGLRWMFNPGMLTAQLCWEEKHAIMLPMCHRYFPDMTEKQVNRLKGQLRKLLGNKKVKVVGHNFKYDLHMLANEGIHVANWFGDTIQMAFALDENMERKNQADCVKRWVPSMAGYSDAFDAKTDKSRMWEVSHEDMLQYGCGDVDSGLRLAYTLYELGQEDKKNWRCYEKIQMPALRMFFKMERQGLRMDREALRKLGTDFAKEEEELYAKMIKLVPARVRRDHLNEDGTGLNFNRPEFVHDALFGLHGIRHPELAGKNPHIRKDGRLVPLIFTEADELPSQSTKHHMPYFGGVPLVDHFIRYKKLNKMRGTYVGAPSSTIVKEVKRLKKGNLPKRIMEALDTFGLMQHQLETISKGKRWRWEPLTVPLKDGVDVRIAGSKVKLLEHSPPKGFWKYLTDADRIHPSVYLDRAVTGRSASRDPNGQNLPKHSEFAPAFRRLFIPSDGFVLIEADLSQIELRIAAWMSGDRTMLRIFRAGGDIHTTTACRILKISEEKFNRLPDKEREHKRFLAKAVNFGFIYGQWPEGFQQYAKSQYGIDLTLEDAEEFRDDYFNLYSDLIDWHKGTESFVRKNGFVRALHGALRRLPSVGSEARGIQNEAVRQAVNSPVQRFGSDLGLMGLFRFGRDCDWNMMRPLGFIHDAGIAEARVGHEEEAASALKWYMQNPPLRQWFNIDPPVPIISDVTIGMSLDAMKKRKDLKAVKPRWAKAD